MMMMLFWLASVCCFAGMPDVTNAAPPVRPPEVAMQVVPCAPAVDPNAWVVLACRLSIPEGWHIYWKNPGASGAPTTIEVEAPEGFRVKPTVYPRPELIPDAAGLTYGYSGEVTLLVPIYPPPRPAEAHDVNFKVAADWLLCRGACFFGDAETSVSIPWGDSEQDRIELEPWATALLAEPRWPRPLTVRPATTARFESGELVVTGPMTRAGVIGFLPDPTPGVTLGTPTIKPGESDFSMTVPVSVAPENTLGQAPIARGLLTFGDEATMPSFEIAVPLDVPAASPSSTSVPLENGKE